MEGKYRNNSYHNDQDDPEYSPEYSEDSPRVAVVSTSNSSPKTRRAVQKRVVSVPIRDVEGSRLKGETPPPSDSWAWRKYGQKPIKGSPYPRGYYRCSSSKGCPARKQVERSRADPTMLVVTYSCEHNHPWPASKNNNTNNTNNNIDTSILEKNINNNNNNNDNNNDNNSDVIDKVKDEPIVANTTVVEVTTPVSSNSTNSSDEDMVIFDNQFVGISEDPLLGTYELKWFSDFESTSTMLDSPIIGTDNISGSGTVIFPMGEEDESLFADLGELPECSVVFRRGVLEDQLRCNLPSWCGTTG